MTGNFTMIPNSLLELSERGEVDCYAIAIYFAIFKHKNQKTGKCFPSVRTIAKLLKIDTKTVMRLIESLRKCGIISYTKKRGVGTSYFSVGTGGVECRNISHITIRNKQKEKQEKNFSVSLKENKINKQDENLEEAKKINWDKLIRNEKDIKFGCNNIENIKNPNNKKDIEKMRKELANLKNWRQNYYTKK